jgi:membrane-associated protease RseP (regulator of RpoE activity)
MFVSPASYLILAVWMLLLSNLGFLLATKLLGGDLTSATIGIGPRIAEFSLGETRYEFRLLPLNCDFRWEFGTSSPLLRLHNCLIKLAGFLTPLLVGLVLIWTILAVESDGPRGTGAEIYFVHYPNDDVPRDLREGDIVLKAGDQEIADAVDLARALSEWKSGTMTFLVERDGNEAVVDLERHEAKEDGVQRSPGILPSPTRGVVQPLLWSARRRPSCTFSYSNGFTQTCQSRASFTSAIRGPGRFC